MKYDDFIVGETFKTKSLHITEEEIIQFATTFDPQYMHIDKEKAEQSRFKGIIASGMHTLSISFKLWVEEGKYGVGIVVGELEILLYQGFLALLIFLLHFYCTFFISLFRK